MISIKKKILKMIQPKIYNPHSNFCTPIFSEHFIQACFIDPGTTSCAFRIVRFYYKYNKIEVLCFGTCDFNSDITKISSEIERQITPLCCILENCHYIVLEQQPYFKEYMKQKIQENVKYVSRHLISFISSKIKDRGCKGIILEVDIKLKTFWIGGPTTRKQNGGETIKKWSKQKAIEILQSRNDQISLQILNSAKYKAKEDLSDVVCYEYAWWSYYLTIDQIPKKK